MLKLYTCTCGKTCTEAYQQGCPHVVPRLKHGHKPDKYPSKTYNTWQGMKARCFNTTSTSYPWYGAKGITVEDPRWLDFYNFLSDMGERPLGKTLDRIDNRKGYKKENCRWATAKEQANNKG